MAYTINIDENIYKELSKYLEDMEYTHFDFNELKLILVRDGDEISEIIIPNIPFLAYNKIREFIYNIRFHNI